MLPKAALKSVIDHNFYESKRRDEAQRQRQASLEPKIYLRF